LGGLVEMKFLKYFWWSSTGFRTYFNFLDLSLKTTLAYWGFLSLVLAGFAMWNISVWFNLAFPVIIKKAQDHLPEFEFRQGKAYSQLPQPYYSNTNDFALIQDIQGTIKNPEKIFPKGLVIRQSEMLYWTEDSPVARVEWKPQLPDGKVNAAYLKDLGDQIVMLWPIFLLIIWLGIIVLGLVQAFLFTSLAGFLERSMDPSFSFAQLLNLAIFALTPGSMIVAIYVTIGFSEIRKELIYFGCYCFFLIMSSGACRDELRGPEEEDDRRDDE
jgi:hypothetical protein